ncbi:MAG: ABC transporter substrate-binding protein, partial [Alphaproteobacteria bacterium]|nr:ABC transporter substrate-binding protein [Alphaproteobacteria bacterium]
MSKYEQVLKISRRASLATLAAVVALPLMMAAGQAAAEAKEVKIVLIAPMSGPWARQGQLMKLGADMAIDDINKAGGVKALGGAKFKLIVADAGDNAEKAKQAAQLALSRHPD